MQDIQTTNCDPVPPARPDTPIACDVADWVSQEPNLQEEEAPPIAVASAGLSQTNKYTTLTPVDEAEFQPDNVELLSVASYCIPPSSCPILPLL